MKKKFVIHKKEVAYAGFFRLEKYWLTHTLYNGGWSEEICRELFVRGRCVAVLLYDCLLYTSPSPRDRQKSRMPSSA